MPGTHPFFTYTTEILSWRLGQASGPADAPGQAGISSPPGPLRTRLTRIVRAAGPVRDIILLGLGTGELAAALAASLPDDKRLTVLSADPAAAGRLRDAGGLAWSTPSGPARLLADASRQALFCLPLLSGLDVREALVTVNPEPCLSGARESLAWVRRMWAGCLPLDEGPDAQSAAAPPPPVTLAVLARPDEPGLDAFFTACAGLADTAVVCWDGPEVPETAGLAAALAMPVRHIARPLDRDFAAQRNALLAACPPGWVLSLDPDERPAPNLKTTLARLTGRPELGAAYFPRLTCYPDADHAKVGYGLWPDLQLRLFRNAAPAAPRYVRPVHEALEGLSGQAVLCLDAPLTHYNRLLADDRAVTAKLAAYDAAAGVARHHLNPDYPTLPLDFFTGLSERPDPGRLFVLPALW